MGFNRELFQQSRNNAGQVFVPPAGSYVCSLRSITLKKDTKTRKESVIKVWVISPTEENFAGKSFFDYQTIVDKNGNDNSVGYDILANFFASCNFYPDLDDLENDANKTMSALIGVEAVITVTPNPKYPQNPTIKVARIISSPISEEGNPPENPPFEETNLQTEVNTQEVDNPQFDVVEQEVEAEPEADTPTLEKGMTVKATYRDQKITGVIREFTDNDTIVKIAMGGKIYPCKIETVQLV